MFCSQGSEGFEAQINKCLENAEYLYDQLQRRSDFQLVFDSKVSQTFRGKSTFYTSHRHHAWICIYFECKYAVEVSQKDEELINNNGYFKVYNNTFKNMLILSS